MEYKVGKKVEEALRIINDCIGHGYEREKDPSVLEMREALRKSRRILADLILDEQ